MKVNYYKKYSSCFCRYKKELLIDTAYRVISDLVSMNRNALNIDANRLIRPF